MLLEKKRSVRLKPRIWRRVIKKLMFITEDQTISNNVHESKHQSAGIEGLADVEVRSL